MRYFILLAFCCATVLCGPFSPRQYPHRRMVRTLVSMQVNPPKIGDPKPGHPAVAGHDTIKKDHSSHPADPKSGQHPQGHESAKKEHNPSHPAGHHSDHMKIGDPKSGLSEASGHAAIGHSVDAGNSQNIGESAAHPAIGHSPNAGKTDSQNIGESASLERHPAMEHSVDSGKVGEDSQNNRESVAQAGQEASDSSDNVENVRKSQNAGESAQAVHENIGSNSEDEAKTGIDSDSSPIVQGVQSNAPLPIDPEHIKSKRSAYPVPRPRNGYNSGFGGNNGFSGNNGFGGGRPGYNGNGNGNGGYGSSGSSANSFSSSQSGFGFSGSTAGASSGSGFNNYGRR